MSHTVIGFFDSNFDAQDAVDALVDGGFFREDIDIDNMQVTNTPAPDNNESVENEGVLTRFFRKLFGGEDEHAERYSTLAKETGAVVRVYTSSEEEAGRAADILDDKGAFNVDERIARVGENITSPRAVTDDAGWNGPGSVIEDNDYPNTGSTKNEETTPELLNEEPGKTPRLEEYSGPGVGSIATGGKRSNARIFEYGGEASARLREDRDNETKLW